MLKIRLQRVGRVHQPLFRLVLTDSENSTKSGRFKEVLGSYDPRTTREVLKAERIQYWISKGASLTPTVHNLLETHKVISGGKKPASPSSKHDPKARAAAKAEALEALKVSAVASEPVAEAPVAEETPVENTENAIIEEVVSDKTV